jgi:hypothetical protein
MREKGDNNTDRLSTFQTCATSVISLPTMSEPSLADITMRSTPIVLGRESSLIDMLSTASPVLRTERERVTSEGIIRRLGVYQQDRHRGVGFEVMHRELLVRWVVRL